MDQCDGYEQHANMLCNGTRNINLGTVTTLDEMVTELKQFNKQVAQARNTGILDEKMAMDAQHHITRVIIQLSKPTTKKMFLLPHLTAALSCVATVSALALALSPVYENLLKLI